VNDPNKAILSRLVGVVRFITIGKGGDLLEAFVLGLFRAAGLAIVGIVFPLIAWDIIAPLFDDWEISPNALFMALVATVVALHFLLCLWAIFWFGNFKQSTCSLVRLEALRLWPPSRPLLLGLLVSCYTLELVLLVEWIALVKPAD